MDEEVLVRTRLALHAVAELVLAGPQYRRSASIRLRVTPGGFGTVGEPDLRVAGAFLVVGGGGEPGGDRLPIDGRTCAELAAAAGVAASALRDVYSGGPPLGADDKLHVDASAAAVLADAFGRGEAGLREFAPDAARVLWPEHFDVGITVDEVNYGVSPGDTLLPEPYAYVGPWQPLTGEFWNFPFGAARPVAQLADVAAFFREGRARVLEARTRPVDAARPVEDVESPP
ncbi:MAG TPA: hypothetical protein VGJ95_05385 [Pseudonocardiaceae bacterium]